MPIGTNQIAGADYTLRKMAPTLSELLCAYMVPRNIITLFFTLANFRQVGYAIPSDGPVGALLDKLGRHVFRPAHLHMMIDVRIYLCLHPQLTLLNNRPQVTRS
jgi:hypothetical protein